MHKKSTQFSIIILFLALLALYAPLTIKTYTLPKKNHSPLSIALLSDLHSSRFYFQDILYTLKDLNPDIITLVGDIIDDQDQNNDGLEFLKELKITFPLTPIFFVMGNHEFHLGALEYKQLIEAIDIKVLGFETHFHMLDIRDTKILIAGVQDPSVTYYDMQGNRLTNIDDKGSILWQKQYLYPLTSLANHFADLKILLTHRAEFAKQYATLPFDVILAGHAHGGQVRIPFLMNGLYAPNQGLFPAYAGGLYPLKQDQFLIVSRGLSLDLTRPRIFNPPEIVHLLFQ